MNAITTVYKNKNASTVWNINVAIKNYVVEEGENVYYISE